MGANPIFLFVFFRGFPHKDERRLQEREAPASLLPLPLPRMQQHVPVVPLQTKLSALCPHNALLWQLLTGRVVPLGAAGWWCCYLSGRTASVATLQVFLFLDYSNTSNPLSSTKSDKVTIIIVITSLMHNTFQSFSVLLELGVHDIHPSQSSSS